MKNNTDGGLSESEIKSMRAIHAHLDRTRGKGMEHNADNDWDWVETEMMKDLRLIIERQEAMRERSALLHPEI